MKDESHIILSCCQSGHSLLVPIGFGEPILFEVTVTFWCQISPGIERLTPFLVGLDRCRAFGTGTSLWLFLNGMISRISPSAPWDGSGSGGGAGFLVGIFAS